MTVVHPGSAAGASAIAASEALEPPEVRVLVVSHTATLGGAERSLLRFLVAAPVGVQVTVACPDGPLAEALEARGLPRVRVRGTTGSLRLHPWHTPRALLDLLRMGLSVRRWARRLRVDLVHGNSTRAGLAAQVARVFGGPPVAVHVRDVLPPGPASVAVRAALRARTIIAISRHVAVAFAGEPLPANVHVPFELVDPHRFAPADRTAARRALDLPPDAEVVAVIAQLTEWKGQDTAIRALAEIRRRRPAAILLIVGERLFTAGATRLDNHAYEQGLHALVQELALDSSVRFLGAREDVWRVLAATDVLFVPSHEEPFGLTVIEGMAMERAVVATARGGPAEVIADGVNGRLVPPRDVTGWAEAAIELLADDELRHRIGVAARERVLAGFTPARYAAAMALAYRATADAPGRA